MRRKSPGERAAAPDPGAAAGGMGLPGGRSASGSRRGVLQPPLPPPPLLLLLLLLLCPGPGRAAARGEAEAPSPYLWKTGKRRPAAPASPHLGPP